MDAGETAGFRETMASLPATLLVGIGAAASLGLSVLTLKVFAQLIGPAGVGSLALLQAMLNLGAIAATLGLNVTVIRLLGEAAKPTGFDAPVVVRAAMLLSAAAASALSLAGILLSDIIATAWLANAVSKLDVAFVSVGAGLTVVSWTILAVQNAYHEVRAVTAINVATAAWSAALGIGLVVALGIKGLAPALLGTAFVQLLIATAIGRRYLGVRICFTARELSAVQELLREGMPVLASQLANLGAAFVIPLLILAHETTSGVGLYRAAAAVSVGYLTFFLSALTQDYLPRVAASMHRGALGLLVERRMRIVLGLGAPLILGLLALGPWLLSTLYSRAFEPALAVLQWQLVGDLLRLPVSVLTFVLLARRTPMQFAGIEMLSGALLVTGTLIGLNIGGLGGVGPAYLVTQVIVYVVVWLAVRAFLPTAPGRLQLFVTLLTLACVMFLLIRPSVELRLITFGTAAAVVAGVAGSRLVGLYRAGQL